MRFRLTLWMVSIYVIIHGITGAVLLLQQHSSIDRVTNARLLERAEEMVGHVAPLVPGGKRELVDQIATRQAPSLSTDRFAIEVYRRDGTAAIEGRPWFDPAEIPVRAVLASDRPVFLRLPMWHEDAARASAEGGVNAEGGQQPAPAAEDPIERGSARAVAMVILGADLEPYVMVVASSDSFAREQMSVALQIFGISALLGPAAAALSGWFVAGIAVAPFQRLRHLASEFGPETLDRSLDIPVHNTEVKELRDQLDRARRRIRDAFAAQEGFLTNVSHELKTPIAVILTESQTLNMEGAPPDVQAFVVSAREEMQRLGKMIESFLMLARLRDKGGTRGIRYAVNDLVMDCVERCAALAEQGEVRLSAELLADEATLDASVSGEPELLRTMLHNLIRNAIRFSPRGGRVVVALHLDEAAVEVSVTDQGPGIPEGQLNSVFERRTGAGAQPVGRGHGLGLAIAQGIAELHSGRVVAENLAGGGCRVSVHIPLSGNAGVSV